MDDILTIAGVFLMIFSVVFILVIVSRAFGQREGQEKGHSNGDVRKDTDNTVREAIKRSTNIEGGRIVDQKIYSSQSELCQACGAMTPKNGLFCLNCGTRINKECPQCFEIIKFRAKVCRFCGYAFSEEELRTLEEEEKLRRRSASNIPPPS